MTESIPRLRLRDPLSGLCSSIGRLIRLRGTEGSNPFPSTGESAKSSRTLGHRQTVWIHSANVQGEAIRHIVKWDYQPAAIEGVPDAFARAYSIMMSGRQGPVYMCYDAGLQEAALDHEVPLRRREPSACRQFRRRILPRSPTRPMR